MAKPKAKPLNLTETAATMRKVILVGGVTLLTLIIGRVFVESAVGYWKATHPAAPPPPTVGFGILPKIQFPVAKSNPTKYTLQAPSTQLQTSSDRIFVFFEPSKRASLLAVDKATKQANTLGFLFDPERITSEMYRWRRTQPLPAVLDYNIINGTFTLRVDWQSNPAFLQSSKLPTEEAAIDLAKQTIAGVGLLPKDMATGSAKVSYLKSSGSSFTNTVSYSESDFLQVDLFRTPIYSKYPVLTDRPTKGTIRAIISGSQDRSQQIVALEYNYLPVDYATVQTYPLITPQAAFTLLANGKGYSANVSDGQTEAVIRSISLAYFDSGSTQQSYLQPIYVFEGDGGFVGYVPAVDAKWISQ